MKVLVLSLLCVGLLGCQAERKDLRSDTLQPKDATLSSKGPSNTVAAEPASKEAQKSAAAILDDLEKNPEKKLRIFRLIDESETKLSLSQEDPAVIVGAVFGALAVLAGGRYAAKYAEVGHITKREGNWWDHDFPQQQKTVTKTFYTKQGLLDALSKESGDNIAVYTKQPLSDTELGKYDLVKSVHDKKPGYNVYTKKFESPDEPVPKYF